jgi:benzoyl-CoA reductase/2-hydroxyglutaryl-CoA dehydratase subunit BcrC/BadD/HgdB
MEKPMTEKSLINPVKSLKALKQINIEYYGQAHAAKGNSKFIAYVNAFTPVELLYAMDMIPIYPENHAAIVGARKMSNDVVPAAERLGYSVDLCSYARCDIGCIEMKLSPTWGLPKPDLLLISNCQCGTLGKWFEVLSRIYDAPMFLLDVPHSGRGEKDPAAEKYLRSQLEDLVDVVEDITGQSLDQDKLKKTVRLSQEASDLWTKVLEAGMARPSPMTVFDQFISMAPIVSQRGTQTAVDFYRDLLNELEERTEKGIGAVENERFRLFWDNLPIWPELRGLSTFLADRGVSLVTSLYTWAWAQLAVGEDDPLGDWVDQYLYKSNLHIEKRIDSYEELAKRFQLDGFLYHSNRSCKFVSQDIPEVRRAITERTGIPGVILDADHCDPRMYTLEELQNQIDNFLEILESRQGHA